MSVKGSNNQDPYIINKNLGVPLQIESSDLPGKMQMVSRLLS